MKQFQLTIFATSIFIPVILFGADKPCNARSFLGQKLTVEFKRASGLVNIGGVQIPSEVMEPIIQQMPRKINFGKPGEYDSDVTLLALRGADKSWYKAIILFDSSGYAACDLSKQNRRTWSEYLAGKPKRIEFNPNVQMFTQLMSQGVLGFNGKIAIDKHTNNEEIKDFVASLNNQNCIRVTTKDKGTMSNFLHELNATDNGVRCLSVGGYTFHDDVMKEINALVKKNNLTHLWLPDSGSVQDSGAKQLAEVLKQNSSLQHIDLCGNHIGDEGAKAFAEALKVNSTLRKLDLINNKIGEEGAYALRDALMVNTTLETLHLGGNKEVFAMEYFTRKELEDSSGKRIWAS